MKLHIRLNRCRINVHSSGKNSKSLDSGKNLGPDRLNLAKRPFVFRSSTLDRLEALCEQIHREFVKSARYEDRSREFGSLNSVFNRLLFLLLGWKLIFHGIR